MQAPCQLPDIGMSIYRCIPPQKPYDEDVTGSILLENFPAAKVDLARATLADLASKAAKAATKAGATLPDAPTMTVVAGSEATLWSCLSCRALGTMADNGHPCLSCGDGIVWARKTVTLEVSAGSSALAGWEFLAVVEPLDGGNLVKRVPGSDDSVDLTSYRSGDMSCDHCNMVRRRSETFVVKSDGSDPNVPAGVLKKVGRNCLSMFLGGLSPAAVLARLGWEKALRAAGDDDEGSGGGGSGSRSYDTLTFLSWTAAVVRLDGWVSKSAAMAYNEAGGDKTPTVTTVTRLLSPPWTREAAESWRKDRLKYAPVAADETKGAAALAWARSLTGSSDYEYNLSLVAKGDTLDPKHAGLMASAVGSYDRATLGALAKAKAAAEVKATAPLGKVTFEGEIIKTSVTENEWGCHEKMTVKVTNPDGAVWFAWGSIPSYMTGPDVTRDDLVGRTVEVTATLEAGKDGHFCFMKRPKVDFADVYGPVFTPPKPPRKPRAKKADKAKETAE